MVAQVEKPETEPYSPRGASLEVMKCRAPAVLIEGPAGTGKSRGLLEKGHLLARKYPKSRGAFIRKTRASMSQSVLTTFESKVVLPGDMILKSGGQKAGRKSYLYENGSEIVVAGLDKADRLMSSDYDWMYIFEATEVTQDDLEKCQTRLRNNVVPYQQVIMDCNPGVPSHWLNRMGNEGRFTRLLSRHVDNPSVTEAYLQILRNLTGARRIRLYEGRWAAVEGQVYESWDPLLMMISGESLPFGFIRWTFFAQDWGFTDPGCTQVWGVGGDRQAICLAEIFRTGMNIDWWIDQLRELKKVYSPVIMVADPAQPGYIDQVNKGGINCIGAFNDIRTGIDLVDQRMKSVVSRAKERRDANQPLDIPHFAYLHNRLREKDEDLASKYLPFSTDQEFDSYVYPDKDKKNPNQVPVDAFNHGMDTTRYAIAHLDFAARIGHGPITSHRRDV